MVPVILGAFISSLLGCFKVPVLWNATWFQSQGLVMVPSNEMFGYSGFLGYFAIIFNPFNMAVLMRDDRKFYIVIHSHADTISAKYYILQPWRA